MEIPQAQVQVYRLIHVTYQNKVSFSFVTLKMQRVKHNVEMTDIYWTGWIL